MPYSDPAEQRKYYRRYYREHKVKWEGRSKQRTPQARHREYERRKGRLGVQALRAIGRKAARRYYWRNRKRVLQRQWSWNQANKERLQTLRQLAFQRNPEARRLTQRMSQQRRKARQSHLPATLTRDQWQAIKVAYDNRCAYCGQRSQRLTQDHVVPLSKGGAYTPDNIVPACRSCNSSKGNRPPPSILPAMRLLL